MSDSIPRSTGRPSAVRARRSAVDHVADHGDTHELPELFDGVSVDAASISTSTFSIVPQSLPATIDEDLLDDDDVVASEVEPDETPSAPLDDVRAPVTDAKAPAPVIVATIDQDAARSVTASPDSPTSPGARRPAAKRPAAKSPAVKRPAAKSPAAKRSGTPSSGSVESGASPSEAPESASEPPATTAAASTKATPRRTTPKGPASTPSDAEPAVSKGSASKPAASKPASSKTAASKTAASKPAASKPAPSKAPASKPPASKAPVSKPRSKAPASKPAASAPAVPVEPASNPGSSTPTPTDPETPTTEAAESSIGRRDTPPVRLASDTIVVDLPPVEDLEVPADERAVAIEEVPVTTTEHLEAPTSSVPVTAAPTGSADREDHVEETPSAPAFAGMSVARALAGAPESSSMLTAERLLEGSRDTRRVPEGFWQKLIFTASGRRIRLADSKAAQARIALTARIAKPLTGGARFVPVLTRKGGVGKTTITTLLGMALADARDDRVIAVDANPDRGTLAERLSRRSEHTVRDLVRDADEVVGYAEFSALVSRDTTRLDVLASDTDPHISQAFDEHDYDVVARLASQYYSIVLTDCGTGIVHSVMSATLRHADTLVIVSGTSLDEARSAAETLSWLEANGYADLAAHAVVVINSTTPGTPSVRLDEIGKHFESRVRSIVRVPFDAHLATGAAVTFADLRPETRLAVRELAAIVVEGLPVGRPRKAGSRG